MLSPRQPRWSDSNYAVLATGSGSWAVMGKYTADMDVAYSNGVHDGDGYVAAQIGYYGTISGSSNMVRERFTVSGSSRTISSVAVRMRRSGGSSPLIIRLETSSGGLIDSVSIPASSVPATSPGGDNGGQVWARASFGQSHTLAKGSTYNIRLSTASGTTYTATPIQEGTDLGFRSFVFSDGLRPADDQRFLLGSALPVGAARPAVLPEVVRAAKRTIEAGHRPASIHVQAGDLRPPVEADATLSSGRGRRACSPRVPDWRPDPARVRASR